MMHLLRVPWCPVVVNSVTKSNEKAPTEAGADFARKLRKLIA